MLVSQKIPRMIDGVSKLSAEQRKAGHVHTATDMLFSWKHGCRNRPGTSSSAVLLASATNYEFAFSHEIRPNASNHYQVLVTDSDLKVFNMVSGAEETVTFPNGKAYLNVAGASVAHRRFKAVTVGDYTFLVNMDFEVGTDAATSGAQVHEAIITVRQGDYGTLYGVTFGSTFVSITTIVNTDENSRPDIGTDVIAEDLKTALEADGTFAASYTCVRSGSQLVISKGGAAFDIDVADGLGGVGLQLTKGQVQSIDDLPPLGTTSGAVVEVTGQPGTQVDNTWVTYEQGTAGEQRGVWRETTAPGILTDLDASTMPWALVRTVDSTDSNGVETCTWVFDEVPWGSREVGDLTSAPWPSFVGKKVSDIFFAENRLGIVAGDSVTLTAAGDLFRFFRKTTTVLLPDDPIDLSSTHAGAAEIDWALPTDQGVLLFSSAGRQFLMSGVPLITPSTVRVDPVGAFPSSKYGRPVSSGGRIYFLSSGVNHLGNGYNHLYDGSLYFDRNTNQVKLEATLISEHIPDYISGFPSVIAADHSKEMVVVLTAVSVGTSNVYPYTFHRDLEGRLLQSAWATWSIGNVISASFVGNNLVMLVKRTEGLFRETIDLTVMPHGDDDNRDRRGTAHAVIHAANLVLHPFYLRDREGNPDVSNRLQVRNVLLNLFDTWKMQTQILTTGKTTRSALNTFSDYVDSGQVQHRLDILSKNTNSQVVILGHPSLAAPFCIESLEWEGWYTTRSKRL